MNRKLSVVSVFPTHTRYEDRFRMLLQLGSHVDRHVLITMDRPPDDTPEAASGTEVVHFDGRYRGWRFAWQALKIARDTMRNESARDSHWVVHDYFVARVGPFVKALVSQKVSTCLSLYFPNFSFWRDRGWRVASNGTLGLRSDMRYQRMFLRRCLQDILSTSLSDAVVANSPAIADDVRRLRLGRKTRVLVLPTEVDLETFHRKDPAQGPAASAEGQVTLLYVGSLQPRKGLGVLLRAGEICAQKGLDFRLVWIGQAPTRGNQTWLDQLVAHSTVAERLEQVGQVPRAELAAFYSAADLLIFPSFYEGSPRVIKEAMACGCPVIASDIPGSRLIDSEGRHIRFYPPEDPDALAQLILDATGERGLLRSRGEACRAYMVNFSTDAIAARLAGLYRELVENSAATPRPASP